MRCTTDLLWGAGLLLVAGLSLVAVAAAPEAPPQSGLRSGTELSFYYFTSSNCHYCQDPQIVAAVIKAKELVAARAKADGMLFAFRGVAVEDDIPRGLATLNEVGPLDELSVGRNAFNTANIAMRLTSGIPPHDRTGIPAIIFFQRKLVFDKQGVAAGEPKYLGSVMGTAIVPWANNGAPVPP